MFGILHELRQRLEVTVVTEEFLELVQSYWWESLYRICIHALKKWSEKDPCWVVLSELSHIKQTQ